MVLLKHITEHISPFLDVCDYFKLRYVTRQKFLMLVTFCSQNGCVFSVPCRAEAMLSNAPPPCGPRRLQLWKSLLVANTSMASCEGAVSIEEFDRFVTLRRLAVLKCVIMC
jgi:hypothetical protein